MTNTQPTGKFKPLSPRSQAEAAAAHAVAARPAPTGTILADTNTEGVKVHAATCRVGLAAVTKGTARHSTLTVATLKAMAADDVAEGAEAPIFHNCLKGQA